VRALVERDDVSRVVVLVPEGSIVDRGLAPGPRLLVARVAMPRPLRLARRLAWEAMHLPRITRREGADALLSFSGMVPRHPDCRVISLISQPRPFERRGSLKRLLQRRAIVRTARRAHRVYAPSRAMAALVNAPDVRVVPHGVDRDLFRPAETPGDEVLAVGDFYRHKRYDLVLAAWRALPEPRPNLRIVGNPAVDPAYFEEFGRQAGDESVILAGRVALAELLRAYRQARVFVIASEHESFAMPLAEALASGVPAVARDLPALRETGGPGAVYVAGDDAKAWADALEGLLRDDALHAELRAAGVRHASAFSWSAAAEAVVTDARA